jgi:hypothetical protein
MPNLQYSVVLTGPRPWLEQALRESGCKVAVAPQPVSLPSSPIPVALATWVRCLLSGISAARLASRTRSAVVTEEPMAGAFAAVAAAVIGSRDRGILSINLIFEPDSSARRRARALLYRLALRNQAAVFTAGSPELSRAYAHLFSAPPARFPVLPDCSLPIWVDPVPPRATPDDGYVFIGGEANRDWNTALAAARLAPHVDFVFSARSRLWKHDHVPSNVTVLLDITEDRFYEVLSRARLVALPLTSDVTAGLVVLMNALLRGKLVLATRTSVTELYFPHDAQDVLVDIADPSALAAAIGRYWQDAELRLAAAEECQRFLVREHSAQDYAREVVRILEMLGEVADARRAR